MNTQDYFASLGVTYADVYGFVMHNLAQPQRIYEVAKQAQVTTSMLTDVLVTYFPSLSQQQVRGYFADAGLDVLALDSQAISLTPETASQSWQIAGYDTNALLGVYSQIVQSLDGDSRWYKSQITYAANRSIPSDYYGEYTSASWSGNLVTGWQAPSTSIMQAMSQLVAPQIGQFTNLQLTAAPSGTTADIRLNQLTMDTGVAAFAYFPDNGLGGDLFFDTDIHTDGLAVGDYGLFTIVHEFGHALGLKHPFEDGVTLPDSLDHRVHTVMSYSEYRSDVPEFSYVNGTINVDYLSVYPHQFMVYDMAALQSVYGINDNWRSGDDVYTLDSQPTYQTLWDAGGEDTLDLSTTSGSNAVRLTSGSYSDINTLSVSEQISAQQAQIALQRGDHYFDDWIAQAYNRYADTIYTGEKALGIAYGTIIENVIGGAGDDHIYDNSVNNHLVGGAGDDYFYLGQGGFDLLDGGSGEDTLVLTQTQAQVQLDALDQDTWQVQTAQFAAQLTGIEWIEFSDQRYALV